MAESGLDIRGLNVSLGGRTIVEDASLAVSAGSLGVVCGPNGAGKSTLLRAALGLLPHLGKVTAGGRELSSFVPVERARLISYVPQRSLLDSGVAVCDVVRQGRYAHGESRRRSQRHVDKALDRCGISELALRSFRQLSGGERRMVLVARALCTGAPVMLLDEPTAWLDIKKRLALLELLRQLAADGLCILCVLHDLDDAARYGDSVFLMNQGKVVATGSAETVLSPSQVRDVYGVDAVLGGATAYRLPGAT